MTIPNLITAFRIILAPVFVILFDQRSAELRLGDLSHLHDQ